MEAITRATTASNKTGSRKRLAGAGSPSAAEATPRRRFWRTASLCVALAALVSTGIYGAWLECPTGAAEGERLNGTRPAATLPRKSIRIGTFNIHGGKGLDGRRDLDRIAESLQDLDFVGLNEVHGTFWGMGNDQAASLGQKLELNWLYAPTEQCWWGTHFGSAVLCKVSLARWRRIPLAHENGNGFRNMVQADVPYPGGVLHVLLTHLDRRGDRSPQLAAVSERFLSLPTPAVLMGDMNSKADDPGIRALLATAGVIDCIGSHVAQDPPQRIDWIFARGLTCRDAGLSEVGASDHPRAWAELDLP